MSQDCRYPSANMPCAGKERSTKKPRPLLLIDKEQVRSLTRRPRNYFITWCGIHKGTYRSCYNVFCLGGVAFAIAHSCSCSCSYHSGFSSFPTLLVNSNILRNTWSATADQQSMHSFQNLMQTKAWSVLWYFSMSTYSTLKRTKTFFFFLPNNLFIHFMSLPA